MALENSLPIRLLPGTLRSSSRNVPTRAAIPDRTSSRPRTGIISSSRSKSHDNPKPSKASYLGFDVHDGRCASADAILHTGGQTMTPESSLANINASGRKHVGVVVPKDALVKPVEHGHSPMAAFDTAYINGIPFTRRNIDYFEPLRYSYSPRVYRDILQHKTMNNATVAARMSLRTIRLSGLPDSVTKDKLFAHLSCGIIEKVEWAAGSDHVLVTFLDEEMAHKFLGAHHQNGLLWAQGQLVAVETWPKRSAIQIDHIQNRRTRTLQWRGKSDIGLVKNARLLVTLACKLRKTLESINWAETDSKAVIELCFTCIDDAYLFKQRIETQYGHLVKGAFCAFGRDPCDREASIPPRRT